MIKKKTTRIALLLLAAVAVFSLSFIGARVGLTSSRAAAESDDLSPAAPSIALPGYDEISLKAGQTEQEVYFYNPKSNRCFMEFSLLLDGETIYSSDRIAPNTKIEHITIAKPLSHGSYTGAILQYSCYDLYSQQELNGAEVAVNLEVE